jgi:hypothetical protein
MSPHLPVPHNLCFHSNSWEVLLHSRHRLKHMLTVHAQTDVDRIDCAKCEAIFWDVTPCSLIDHYKRFGRTCGLPHQATRISQRTVGTFTLAAKCKHKPQRTVHGICYVKGKAIPVTGREGPEGCETSRLPHYLDNRLTDGGEVVSLTRRPPFTPRKIPGTHFC